jgi:ribosomal protein L11 methyltransferase
MVNSEDKEKTAPAALSPDGEPGASTVARLATVRETAEKLLALADETFDSTIVAVSAFEEAGGWHVAIHFREPPNETAVRALVACACGGDAANALVFEQVAHRDWVKASLDGLAPVTVGRFFVHGAHDRAQLPANSIGIEIEAALAFGTGHHGTTQGCLRALDRMAMALRPRNILDVGTGSGVLAIAAARTLHAPVLASDIDSRAVRAARGNAALNRAGGLITIVQATGLSAQLIRRRAPYDLVFANILLEPIRGFAKPLARLLAPDARLVLSGLLTHQAQPALAAYLPHGLALETRIRIGGWVTLVLRRRGRGVAAARHNP